MRIDTSTDGDAVFRSDLKHRQQTKSGRPMSGGKKQCRAHGKDGYICVLDTGHSGKHEDYNGRQWSDIEADK